MMQRPNPMQQALKNKKMNGFDITVSIMPTDEEGSPAEEAGETVEHEKEEQALGLAPAASKLVGENDDKDIAMTREMHNPDLTTEEWMQKDKPMDKEAFGENLMKSGIGKNSIAGKQMGMLKK